MLTSILITINLSNPTPVADYWRYAPEMSGQKYDLCIGSEEGILSSCETIDRSHERTGLATAGLDVISFPESEGPRPLADKMPKGSPIDRVMSSVEQMSKAGVEVTVKVKHETTGGGTDSKTEVEVSVKANKG